MAFIVGYVSREEKAELERWGWDVEDAKEYGLVGDSEKHLLSGAPEWSEAVVIFVNTSLFDALDGPYWAKGPEHSIDTSAIEIPGKACSVCFEPATCVVQDVLKVYDQSALIKLVGDGVHYFCKKHKRPSKIRGGSNETRD